MATRLRSIPTGASLAAPRPPRNRPEMSLVTWPAWPRATGRSTFSTRRPAGGGRSADRGGRPNGAGKTTLLEIITGDQQPDRHRHSRARPGDRLPAAGGCRVAGRPALAEVLAGAGAVTGIAGCATSSRDGRRDRGGRAGRADGRVRPAAASVRGHGRLRAGGGGPPHPGRPGLCRGRHGTQHGRVLRRLDDAHRAGAAAAAEPGPPAARRADQPPGPGVGRVAAGVPGRIRRRGAAGQPRSGLHQRRRQPRGRAAWPA